MQYALDKMMKNPYKYMSSFNWKKNNEDSIKESTKRNAIKSISRRYG